MKKIISLIAISVTLVGCEQTKASDSIQSKQQEVSLQEGTAQVGMPAIKNFRERKLLRDILEMRDSTSLVTYTYRTAQMSGDLIFMCQSIGYPLPYSTQFTNPEKVNAHQGQPYTMPQADPNGLFSPSSSEASWVMCKDPNSDSVRPVYSEDRLTTSQFKLTK